MENSQRARYDLSLEKSDYFLDPNQTLTKEKIQAACAKSKLLESSNNIHYQKENININIIPPKKTKNEKALKKNLCSKIYRKSTVYKSLAMTVK